MGPLGPSHSPPGWAAPVVTSSPCTWALSDLHAGRPLPWFAACVGCRSLHPSFCFHEGTQGGPHSQERKLGGAGVTACLSGFSVTPEGGKGGAQVGELGGGTPRRSPLCSGHKEPQVLEERTRRWRAGGQSGLDSRSYLALGHLRQSS